MVEDEQYIQMINLTQQQDAHTLEGESTVLAPPGFREHWTCPGQIGKETESHGPMARGGRLCILDR
jgi:hypothetical protein